MSTLKVPILRVEGAKSQTIIDSVAIEEPLEIRLRFWEDSGWVEKPVSITMRTPSDDEALAAGFLYNEGIIQAAHIDGIKTEADNTVIIKLKADVRPDLQKLQRNFYTTSSCGVCGKTSLEALGYSHQRPNWDRNLPLLLPDFIAALPEKLATAQPIFDQTGGLHAAGLFDWEGRLLFYAEDIGRHNAVDKITGKALLEGHLPFRQHILVLSGRACFELLHKALAMNIPVVVAVGAPSSLAVETAQHFNQTLIGFTRQGRFNVYTGQQRLQPLN
ncbi:MAG: formate dehydrogenase accessory sulfurtransferase FdhD [Spirosomataceae bacterium]